MLLAITSNTCQRRSCHMSNVPQLLLWLPEGALQVATNQLTAAGTASQNSTGLCCNVGKKGLIHSVSSTATCFKSHWSLMKPLLQSSFTAPWFSLDLDTNPVQPVGTGNKYQEQIFCSLECSTFWCFRNGFRSHLYSALSFTISAPLSLVSIHSAILPLTYWFNKYLWRKFYEPGTMQGGLSVRQGFYSLLGMLLSLNFHNPSQQPSRHAWIFFFF